MLSKEIDVIFKTKINVALNIKRHNNIFILNNVVKEFYVILIDKRLINLFVIRNVKYHVVPCVVDNIITQEFIRMHLLL